MADNGPPPIYPESFYNIIHPTQPWVSVQFRVVASSSANSDITQDNVWQEVALNPNSYFESLEITDGGGAKQLTLVLYDQYFSFIENVVMQSIFAVRLSNSTIPQEGKSISDDNNLNIVVSNASLVNLRVKFGYTDTNANDAYFDKEPFTDRIKSEKPTIRSEWYYFMIRGMQNNFADDGLHMTISAISLTSNLLNNVKLVQRFARLVDTPKNIIETFAKKLSEDTNGKKSSVSIAAFETGGSEEPISDGNPIEILLGSEPVVVARNKTISSYKQLADIFSEIVSKVPSKNVDSAGNVVVPNTDKNVDGDATAGTKTIPYSYYISKQSDGTEKIVFYYPNPGKARQQQPNQRVYYWREFGRTIVESLSITTSTDFATMSQKIIVKDDNNNVLVDLVPLGKENTGKEININANLGVAQSVQKTSDTANNIVDWSFVSDIVEARVSNSPDVEARSPIRELQNQFTRSINNQVFRGTITLPGDPFYSFDKEMIPYQYIIKIIVLRPSQVGLPEVSYISGDYAISNIKHTVNNSGFKTTLEVMRWPNDEQDKKVVDVNADLLKYRSLYGL